MQVEYFSKHPFTELRSQDGKSKIKFCTYGYAFPDATNPYDADWHKNFLYIKLPSFQVKIDEIILEGRLLQYYQRELVKFSNLTINKVSLEPTESFFGLHLSFDSRKNVVVTGFAEYPLGEYGAMLEFNFLTDLTFIDKYILGILGILKKFPPRK